MIFLRNPDYIYALVEAENNKQGLYVSKDRGESWNKKKICYKWKLLSRSICDLQNIKFFSWIHGFTIKTVEKHS